MTKRQRQRRPSPPSRPAEPIDMVDGIPDRSLHRPLWKYVLLAVIALAWLGVLVYCWLAGSAGD